MNKYLTVFVFSASLLASTASFAQIEQQTGIADPGRAGERISEEKLLPSSGPDVRIESRASINAPAGAENIKFNFNGIRLTGANEYSPVALEPLYADMIGTEISLADLYAIANSITLKYRNDGYILTQVIVPPQTIQNGIAELQVVEGFINNISIQADGETDFAVNLIEEYASRISTGGALNLAEMERQLLLVNDLPGVTARSIISPSPSTPGAADMLIIVERDPFEALVGVDNFGSRFLGPFQFSGVATANSFLGFNERITAQVVAAPDDNMELAFGGFTYEQPVGPLGTTLAFSATVTDTQPGYTLRQFDVEGLSKSMTITAEHPFIRSRDTNLFGRLAFDWRNVESQNNVAATIKDRIRAVRAGARADFLDRLLGVAVNTLDLEISQGLDVFGASDEGGSNLTRAEGDPQFTKANLQVQRLQRVTNSVNILLEGRGQLSNNPLLSSEEFGVGGISSVRGYEPSEVTGDDGVAGKVEVQWNNKTRKVQLYTFLDTGTVWNQDPNNSGQKRESRTSTGVGVRLDLPMDIDAEFIAAQPIQRNVESRGTRDPQFFFSLNKEF